MAQRLPATASLVLLIASLMPACGSDDPSEMGASPADTNPPSGDAAEEPNPNLSNPTAGNTASPSGNEVQPANGESQPMDLELMPPATPGRTPAAGAPGEASPPVPSAGCGTTGAVASGRFTLEVDGASRDYILQLPEGYDASRPYRLIFGWHPRGGTAEQVANGFGGGFYGLERLAEGSAIFVSPEGIDAGWANTGGRDIAFLDAMLARLEGELCIDRSRIFSTGFSYGGMMSLAIGCARGDVFRAIAPMSGALYSGCEDGTASIALLGFHGVDDTVVPLADGVRGRDEFVERNGCEPAESATEAEGCLSFQGCAEGAPVTWCEFDGGHTPAPGSAEPIWTFFSQF